MFFQQSKFQSFEFLKDKIENKLLGKKFKLLSYVGMVAFMPLYTMLAFDVLNLLCNQLDARVHSFLWKGIDNRRKCSFISGSVVCKAKGHGKLEVRSFQAMNLVLLTKLAWGLVTDHYKLWVKVLKAKYCLTISFLKKRGVGKVLWMLVMSYKRKLVTM